MVLNLRRRLLGGSLMLLGVGTVGLVQAASPTVDQALKLTPIQKDVEIDVPSDADAKQCKIQGEKSGEHSSWVVRNSGGQVLRRFVDTDSDNVVDQWCYYRDGIEVYRDIDANFNGKPDQYRWLNTAGSRWALDANEDGRIDSWKSISAEEVSAEVVRALADQDGSRFGKLLLTESEIGALGLSDERTKELSEKVRSAATDFVGLARKQKAVTAKTNWIHFGASRPGMVPAGTDGATKDLLVYENVLAMVDTAGTHGQVQIGTLVRTGDTWKLLDLPVILADDKTERAEAGYFFRASLATRDSTPETTTDGPSAKSQKLLSDLEALDKRGATLTSAEAQARYNAERADLLQQLADGAEGAEERGQWLRQLADSVGAAAQSGQYPEGVARLQTLLDRLKAESGSHDLAAYVQFRILMAGYAQSISAPNPDYSKIQTNWLASLEEYVDEYPTSPDAADAMMQLGLAEEFAGQEDSAKKWYGKVVSSFGGTNSAKKAAGAIARLESVGKAFRLAGKTSTGATVDTAQYKGKVLLIHYWATWCEPCVADLTTIKQLHAKYGSGFMPIGVNLNSVSGEASEFLKQNPLTWPQVTEPGGLDSRLAQELGIQTLPAMILVDKDGKVLNRAIHMAEVEKELQNRVTPAKATTLLPPPTTSKQTPPPARRPGTTGTQRNR